MQFETIDYSGVKNEEFFVKLTRVRREKTLFLSGCQGHRCAVCGSDTWHPSFGEIGLKKRRATLEHFVAQYEGGTDDLDNLVMSCVDCNSRRGHIDIYEFIENGLKRMTTRDTPERIQYHKSRGDSFLLFFAYLCAVNKYFSNFVDYLVANQQK